MRSKTSYFNPTLFRKNLTRFWPLWGGASAAGALAPLAVLMELVREGFRAHAGDALEVTSGYYHILAYIIPTISLLYAALCALAVWHYLYNARSVGFYHALPVTRMGLFATNFLSGMTMLLIPYAVTGALAVLVTAAAGLFDPAGVLVMIAGILGESFFYFCAATLIIFITGNPFAFAGFYFIFHFLAAGAEYLAAILMTRFYLGVNQAYEGVLEFLSPTIFLSHSLEVDIQRAEHTSPEGWTEYLQTESVTLQNGWIIAVYALAGVVLLGCAWALYQRRRSESAGDVVAVGWMKPVFRYGVALCTALAGGTLLYTILCEGFQAGSTADVLPMALCMAAAGVIGYYIASMLLAKSLKVFRGSGKGLLITAVASVAVCVGIAADPFGVEKWVPQLAEVEQVNFNVYGYNGPNIHAGLDDPAAIQKILDLHSELVAELDMMDQNTPYYWQSGSLQLLLYYYVASGPSDYDYVSRTYNIPISDEALAQSEALRQIQALVSDPDIQEENIFDFRGYTGDELTNLRLTNGFIGMVYDSRARTIESVDLSLEQAKTLEAAIRRDIQARHFGKTMFIQDDEQYRKSAYSTELQLNYLATHQRYDGLPETFNPVIDLSISTYCTETLKALEDIGVVDATHRLLTQYEYDCMERQPDGTWQFTEDVHSQETVLFPSGTVLYPDGSVVFAEEDF